ncbi:MAG TPA: RHS repeat-associated core domain-containing protein [Spirochaetota bacterium]|jgi:RHS repeat-associated protein|nr:MAG: hypothetical protein BWX91_01856 [Spirochaetes bacterium ADurb.Bin133]HNZ26634.1 RHS repeat-associated core domain-containing protein [Spirochaetota bacterium]HPY87452.1 RHS repeat-associated core domain-containing protein [Spirochaetota bacterium]HQB60053.1 RHS repeat-associated core domain-containing protein [Spirochaetota bacterium]
MTSRDGTRIYRYNLDGKLKKVYYSYNREPINDSKFNNLKNIGDNGFDYDEYKLIKEIKYNCSGIRIYEINNFVEKEEIVYYNTPFGYLGNKNITKNEERLLVNYYSSSSAITANLESVSNDFGNSSGYAYQSSMISYNGGNFGVERAAMNQKIPVTIDGQALGEIKYNGSTTDNLTIDWGSYNGQLSGESITIITSYSSIVLYNYVKDERGCVRAVTEKNTDGSIKIKWNADYKPFGELLIEATTIDWLPLKTFALHEYDTITNLYYCQNRWYDAEAGSFISEDPIKDGNNFYAYCGNNPIGMVDPTGLYGQHNPSGVGFGDPDQYYKDLQYGGYNAEQGIYDYNKYKAGIRQWQEGAATNHGNSFSLAAMGYSGSGTYQGDTRWFTGDSSARNTAMYEQYQDAEFMAQSWMDYLKNQDLSTSKIGNGNWYQGDSVTYLAEGTKFGNLGENKYFLDSKNNPDSINAARELGNLFGSLDGIFFGWNGKNLNSERVKAANILLGNILDSNYSKNMVINLVGHSHGGNIMVMVANGLESAGYKVNLLTLDAPVREYQLNANSTVNHIQTYSSKDWVQPLGGFPPFTGKYTFSGAQNINVTSGVNYQLSNTNTYQTINNNSGWFGAPCPYHQMTRAINFVKEMLIYGK